MLLEAFFCEFGSARTMSDVDAVIRPFAVVKQREQPHHCRVGTRFRGEQQAVSFHLLPMGEAVQFRFEEAVGEDVIL